LEIIYILGETGEMFYVILQGSVSVRIPNPDVKDFKKRMEKEEEERKNGEEKMKVRIEDKKDEID
jgi:hypothetical protein